MRFEGLAGNIEAQGLARHSTPDLTFNGSALPPMAREES